MSKYTPQVGDIAEYTFPTGPNWARPGANDGETVTGDVVKVGKSYVDVQWREGRKERFYFERPEGVTFKAAA